MAKIPQPTQQIPPKSFVIKTDKPRPHVCLICTRSFARLEHLKRHERSHTKEKPFQCPVCERCFARRDLLLRHKQKLHASFPEPPRASKRRSSATPRKPPSTQSEQQQPTSTISMSTPLATEHAPSIRPELVGRIQYYRCFD